MVAESRMVWRAFRSVPPRLLSTLDKPNTVSVVPTFGPPVKYPVRARGVGLVVCMFVSVPTKNPGGKATPGPFTVPHSFFTLAAAFHRRSRGRHRHSLHWAHCKRCSWSGAGPSTSRGFWFQRH